jgi:hypothetical protein
VAWSRILDDEEALCVLNAHGTETRGADIVVDANLNPPGSAMTVVLTTGTRGDAPVGPPPVGSTLPVQRTAGGAAFVRLQSVSPSDVLVLVNHA